ncbi:MAG: response regulator [Gemmatimonadales bacterium]|nr:response regulator [Gemmatimonadales bacterium]
MTFGAATVERRRWHREANALYRQLVELAPDGILVHDGERIVLGNAAAARLADASSREELVGLPIDTFLQPPYLKAVQSLILDAREPVELSPPVRDTFRRLDGSLIDVEVRAVAFMNQGSLSAHLVIRDITNRLAQERSAHEQEERLQQALQMEAIGVLAGGVAHEVNNMMAVVLGFSNFLLDDQRLPPTCHSDVREIRKAADRAALLTRQLLSFSRCAVHQPVTIDLTAAVHDAESGVSRLMGKRQHLIVAAQKSIHVHADPGQLLQVIINLAVNARDAMPDGGTLTLTTAVTELSDGTTAADGSTIPANRYATLVVRDTGTGITPWIQARIFAPFFTTKPLGQGTGLGLSAVQGILAQHHGYITVTSAPDLGTTFTVLLPLLPTATPPFRKQTLPPADATMQRDGVTVLVVDDEPAVLSVVTRCLEHGGLRVLQARNGGDALAAIEMHGPPDLVLTDLMMPGIDGAELARRLKEQWPDLPVIFISGFSAEELRRRGTLESSGNLVQKPFTPAELTAAVSKALGRSASR